jgi:small GTP-binding protein
MSSSLSRARRLGARAWRSCASALVGTLAPVRPAAAPNAGGHRFLPLPPPRAFASPSRASSHASDPSQPRATTSLTDREILAAQRSPDEYLSVPLEDVRTFSIIAHVDHGKSTLADRLMELTGAVPPGGRKQYLDRLPVERARGITVKAQAVSLLHDCPRTNRRYLLNLVDTPGHADFAFEVSRSLAACDGALLLVDATQGVQAQTIATFYLALEQGLAILPVANKVDMVNADVPRVAEQMRRAFGVDEDELIPVSAKTGENVRAVLDAVTTRIEPPTGDSARDAPMRALLLDCHYDPYRGAVAVVQIVDGEMRVGDAVAGLADGGAATTEVMELGLMTPEPLKTNVLRAGHVGYVITSSRDVKSAKIGDTLVRAADAKAKPRRVAPLPGFRPAKPMVFQGLFPASADQHDALRAAVERLTLNDASVTVAPETSVALGPGFRCGFLGLLHADVFYQRLREEFSADVISTAPTVPYRVRRRTGGGGDRSGSGGGGDRVAGVDDGRKSDAGGDEDSDSDSRLEDSRLEDSDSENWTEITSPSALEHPSSRQHAGPRVVEEPMVDATIICASDAVGKIVELCVDRRGAQLEHAYLDDTRVMLRYRLPLGEIASDFSDELKSRTSGFATFDYEEAGWEPSDVVRLDVLVNGHAVDALATLVHRDKATRRGRDMCRRLKDALPRQLYEVAVQAAVGGKVLARETISAMRKNVLAKCYGGDVSRKKKLLAKQKEGKRRMRRVGNVDIPAEAFAGLLSTDKR